MKLQPKDKKQLLKAAPGEIPDDLLIKHIQLADVITGEIYPASVFVYDGTIVHVEYKNLDADLDKAVTIVDGQGHYLIPGFLDAHEHIESLMMTPHNFAKAVLLHGTMTVITDPYEIANVWGVEGVRYMHDNRKDLPMRQLVDISSCVPAIPGLENTGTDFLAERTEELCDLKHAIGPVEAMDFLAAIHSEDRMMDILKVAEDRGLYTQGHASYVSGWILFAYLCGGPNTCHETRVSDEGLEKLRSAMYVDARDNSIIKNAKDIREDAKQVKFFDHPCFYTDDREMDDILNNGHMSDVVRNVVRYGIDPVTVVESAIYNMAREIKIENLGAIAPGSVADMPPAESLEESKSSHVFYNGELVTENGKLLAGIEDESYAIEYRNSMHVKKLSVENFRIQTSVENGTVKVNLMGYKSLLLSNILISYKELPVENSYLKLNDDDLKFVAVVNRHEGHDTATLGTVCGFGTAIGALASTVSHDSHDLTTVYDTVENALSATNELTACEGGICVVKDGAVLHTLQFPLAGLIPLKPVEELAVNNALMKDVNRTLGLVDMENPLLRIATLVLPVIPEAGMSDLGLTDALKKEIVPLFV